MSEQPSISVPCAQSAQGLPIGLQITGPRFDDLGVLQIARAFEQLRAPLPPYPSPPAALQRDVAQPAPQTAATATDPASVPATV